MRRPSTFAFLVLISLCDIGVTACAEDPKLAGNPSTQSGGSGNSGTSGSSGTTGGSSASTSDGSSGSAGMGTGPTDIPPNEFLDQGTRTTLSLNSTLASEKASIDAQLASTKGLAADALASRYATSPGQLGYDPSQAIGLDVIQKSDLGLNDSELQAYQANGLVISSRRQFPTFTYGYASIYSSHLPLFVSADSILYPVHRSFDKILSSLESNALVKELDTLLGSMRSALQAATIPETMRADDDLYLTVAHSLLKSQMIAPAAGADETKVQQLYAAALSASGIAEVNLFGVKRTEDFSQFAPRGHYTESEVLKSYFRAMMWLGRVDFRLIETQSDGSQVFRRRQLEATIALRQLVDAANLPHYRNIDSTVTAFVGEHDNMVLDQVDALLNDLGVSDLSGIVSLSDEVLAKAVAAGGYGMQRIASQYMVNGTSGTLPLSAAFALFGQRFTPDSFVFSNVVYDRVPTSPYRMMPNPLDVAFGAFGNNQAASLLKPELDKYNYAGNLAATRVLVDAYPNDFWQGSLYTLWLSALRQLSPSSETSNPQAVGLPRIAATQAWGRRLINTQLASWAELRHDTLLYAKQSYTGSVLCEFPDAYVEPYPQFFQKLSDYADKAQQMLSTLSISVPQNVLDYFQHLSQVAKLLGAMAQNERTGTPHTADQMAFINETVSLRDGVCTAAIVGAAGWYPGLFYGGSSDSVEFDPTIADVHTQPTDESGNPIGRILHVGTGQSRLMIASIDTCSGPRAYAGLVSSYYEVVTDDWKRMTDEEWAPQVQSNPPANPSWLQGIVVP